MIALHHVQLAIPPGGEGVARRFYAEGLGLTEVAKPAELAGRGGVWFRCFDGVRTAAELHLGVEDPFRSARKAHPALLMSDEAALLALAKRLTGLRYDVDWSQRDTFSGYLRFHVFDGHGNRIEVMTEASRAV